MSNQSSPTSTVRVRFAPSPTGYLHVGGARTALYNFLLARALKGEFILRIEDTDQERSTEEALRSQIEDLVWLGLKWDEGPDPKSLKDLGSLGPYRQSQRLPIYREYAHRLLKMGRAYYCFCTDEDLRVKREQAFADKESSQYDGTCRKIDPDEALKRKQNGEAAVVRFRVEEGKEYSFHDLIRGPVHFPPEMVGDFVLLRSDGMPVYNYCCTLDDALMKVTHVLRAEEHLNNTLRQLMIYEALSFPPPQFAHLSIILGSDRKKLSKRQGATSVHDFAERGFLPEAILNFIALLGWSSPQGQEVLSLNDLISQFTLDRFQPSSAVFDEEKLTWLNGVHIRNLTDDDLWGRLSLFLDRAKIALPKELEWRKKMMEAFRPKLSTLADIVSLASPLDDSKFQLTPEGKEVLKWPDSKKVLTTWVEQLNSKGPWIEEEEFKALQKELQTATQVKGKNLFQPLRVAVIGAPEGADLAKLIPLIPSLSLKIRAENCLNMI